MSALEKAARELYEHAFRDTTKTAKAVGVISIEGDVVLRFMEAVEALGSASGEDPWEITEEDMAQAADAAEGADCSGELEAQLDAALHAFRDRLRSRLSGSGRGRDITPLNDAREILEEGLGALRALRPVITEELLPNHPDPKSLDPGSLTDCLNMADEALVLALARLQPTRPEGESVKGTVTTQWSGAARISIDAYGASWPEGTLVKITRLNIKDSPGPEGEAYIDDRAAEALGRVLEPRPTASPGPELPEADGLWATGPGAGQRWWSEATVRSLIAEKQKAEREREDAHMHRKAMEWAARQLEAKLASRSEERDRLLRERQGEVWLWQGDGTDEPESLTCPVLMHPDHLRKLLAQRPTITEEEIRAVREAEKLTWTLSHELLLRTLADRLENARDSDGSE